MAYYVIDQTTSDLIYTSDFEPPNTYAANGHHVFEVAITVSDLEKLYTWDKTLNTFTKNPTNIISKRDFIRRFTIEEYAAVKQNLPVIAALDYYWQMLMLSEFVDLAHEDTILGVNALEQMAIIAPGRSTIILGYNNG